MVFANTIVSDSYVSRFLFHLPLHLDCKLKMEKPNLISGISDGGYKLELHPAYRWAIENSTDDILKYVDAEAEADEGNF